MTGHRFLIGFGVLFMSLALSATETQAKVRLDFDPGQFKGNGHVVSMGRTEFLRAVKSLGLKVQILKLSKHDFARLAKSSSKGCGCDLLTESEFGFGSCFKSCITSWGVNQTTIIGCATVCGGAIGTGNPGAIGACAGCLGVGEEIVLGCVLYCVWRDSPVMMENVSKLRSEGRGSRHETRAPKLPAKGL